MPALMRVYEGKDYGIEGNGVWVRGPWEAIKPSADVDEVVDQLCPAVLRLSGATDRDYGTEYCGDLYTFDGLYYASLPSPLGAARLELPSKTKYCRVPNRVMDARGQVVIIADYHSHPWPGSTLSMADKIEDNQRWSIRIQFDTTCHVLKLVPYVHEKRPGEVYERRSKTWVLIGIIKPEDKSLGIITPVAEQH